MTQILFKNAQVLDPIAGELHTQHVLVVGGYIREVSRHLPQTHDNTQVIDVKDKVLMPGLCDAHVHVTAVAPDFISLTRWSASYVALRSREVLENMLMRGFTTVRDAGGTDYGIAEAVAEGHLVGPRILFSGHALSQTGGHGDMRLKGEHALEDSPCCVGLGKVCDGVTEVRRACREEIRKGAHQIKLMASGGIVSPTDRITSTQFSIEEIKAAVEEATAANIYVMAHAYTARAINRALDCGVRSIEHGNLLDESSIELFLKHQAFLVPTLSAYASSAEEGLQAGMQKSQHEKIFEVLEGGLRALELAHRSGVKLVYGSDLFGSLHKHQLREFALRSQVQKPLDILRAATINAAELFNMSGQIGVIAANACADLLVLDGDPLTDIGVLQAPDKYLKLIMKDGQIYKNAL